MAQRKKRTVKGQLELTFEKGGSTKKKSKKSPIARKRTSTKQAATVKKRSSQRPAPRADQKSQNIEDAMWLKAEEMANNQRAISVSEFFAKNRHLLGFDNPRKALLTTVKEAVDNSLDACEEAHILPELEVGIKQTGENRFLMWVQDNGPGIVKAQIPHIFGRLLYGSKFHLLRMSRGQQGIGISAAGMYGLITTGKSVKIISRTGKNTKAHYYEIQINTQKNRPEIITDETIQWDVHHGTRVEIEMEARYHKGRQSVDEYLSQTAIVNPHTSLRYLAPDGTETLFKRSVTKIVTCPKAVKPHPYGVELGILIKMAKDTTAKRLSSFMTQEFSRVSSRVCQQILTRAKLPPSKRPRSLNHAETQRLHQAISDTKIMAPSTSCVEPIGEDALQKGLQKVVEADFYTATTRPPSVYRGNPFQIEVALAYGINKSNGNSDDNDEQELMRVLRFANRVPLLYQQSACAMYQSILQTNWRLYGLSQSRGALPAGAATALVHIASVWVPFTSESKEAVAHYPELIKEIKLALSECGRKLGRYLRGKKRQQDEALKRSYIEKYIPAIGEALRDILSLKDTQVKKVLTNLEIVLERSRSK